MLLSSEQPGVVLTLRVDSPIPQFSEQCAHAEVEALKHVALTVKPKVMTMSFNEVK